MAKKELLAKLVNNSPTMQVCNFNRELTFLLKNNTARQQQGNLLRMRQISIETWRFPRRNNEMFVVVW